MSQLFDAEAVATATGGRLVRPGPSGPVVTDSRALKAGDWFVALVGPRFDGHDYVAAADAAGAAGCVVERELPGRAGLVVVPDTTRALQDLGRAARAAFVGPVVGLTGSSGKTTTRALCALALSPLGRVHQTTGNLNNHLGVPLTLLARPDDAAAMVVEMGTSSPGEIAVLADIATPDVRLIVNVGPAHLLELGGLDGVAVEKGAIFRSARPGNTVCVNVDDARVAAIPVPAGVRRLTWGSAGDVALLDAVVDPATLSTTARWRTPEGEVSARIPAPGHHIAHNAAGALCCALSLGIDPREAAAALERYEPVGMRLRSEPLPTGALALNDTYNANPQSMEASLRLLASLPGRRLAVLGDMLELGPDEARFHADVVALAKDLGLDVVLVGPRMVDAARAHPELPSFLDPADAGPHVAAWLAPGSTVLFKGSRGARVERCLEAIRAATSGAS
ncbi:MAG: UDP-N-acetylmuramoyl-tripeptide--D-alanyl-D-alanine ligase [Alphaproteobacteria bacterium]|nr:UDP-N-acetylmuramoyl-tripeptide--D-alanyl-D-alanine ligase [Alphaproteobacteria bacterium]